ncbi:ATP-binding protein [Mixta tenebrionis]|uniref:ATP-binding protein n=1 Tax=Mixta tenebrionis TaxID=2562439 RepID=A0A506VGG3_9GAMM|nr:ATP-binding protein [Mixta tenebrionis]
MYLSSYSLIEPEDEFYFYIPSWLNVWESHIYNKALKATRAQGWGFKRFGTRRELYAREMIRKPDYIKYIEALEQASDIALQQLAAKVRMQLIKSRTALFYVDSWGEAGLYENMSSALHAGIIDTLPKNLLKKFSVNGFTCKMRGEKQSLMQAMRVAQDYLNWDICDFVVICAAYRSIPLLVFSDEDIAGGGKRKSQDTNVNLSVERVGCFIFSKRESALRIDCGGYIDAGNDIHRAAPLITAEAPIDRLFFTGLRKSRAGSALLKATEAAGLAALNLTEKYGGSGCLTPALSWVALEQQPPATARTIVPDNYGGYNYFDTWRD